MRVLVTDGSNRAALAITRSLGRAGHEVFVGEAVSPALAQTSRYCARRVTYPSPVVASDAFIEDLVHLVRTERIEVVIPVSDVTTFLITEHRAALAPCVVPFADAETVRRAADKVGLMRTAERIGVAVPRTIVIDRPEDLANHELEFPLVIKPRQSRVRTEIGWLSSSVSHAADTAQLAADIGRRPAHHFPLMLQERIVGRGCGVFACYQDGRPIALFAHQRLRERPPWGGVSVLAESVALDPRVRDAALALLDELRWHGVAMVEFKQDDRDGIPKLMEINGRFWGSLQLAIDAGVDFPKLLVDMVGGPVPPQPPYRVGVRTRWLWGDVDSLLQSAFRKDGPTPRTYPGPLRALRDFCSFYSRNLYYDNPKPDDIRPWLFETYERLRAVRKGGSSSSSSSGPVPSPVRKVAKALAFTATVARSFDELGLEASEWNRLAAAGPTNSIFQTHEWASSWYGSFTDQFEPFFVSLRSSAGEPVAIAPFVLQQRRHERVLRLLGDGRADYLDLLVPNDPKDGSEAIRALLEPVWADSRWDSIELDNLLSGSLTGPAVLRYCRAAGYHSIMRRQYRCPTLVIDGHRDEATEIINRPSLKRRTNYFNRNGRLVYRDLTDPDDVAPFLDAFFQQHIDRWRGKEEGESLFLDARNRLFYRQLTRRAGRAGSLLFSIVLFDDRPIAFHYGFDYAGSVIWYKPAFDPEFARHSPGLVMVRHLIEYAVTRERRELDFTIGEEAFKQRFTNSARETVQLRIFRDSARYHWERSKQGYRAPVRKLAQ